MRALSSFSGRAYLFLLALLLLFFLSQVLGQQQSAATDEDADEERPYEMGVEACPCLMDIDEVPPMNPLDYDPYTTNFAEVLGNETINSTTYGIGCAVHDFYTPQCSDESINDCARRKQLVPPPLSCDTSWCQRNWCFVHPSNCTLAHKRHPAFAFSDRYYSYATCGDMDAFTSNRRFASLEGQIFRIGLNSNTGGWLGSYHKTEGIHFQGPITSWTGLAVDFVVQAAIRGRFLLELAQPPEFLKNRSQAYFASESQFDLCVYATALGYLDMCVAQYTITDQRASSTDWLLLGSQSIYLVVHTESTSIGKFEFFLKSIATIFQPFTPETWIFIVLFVIPVLGALMVVHERGRNGTTYPTEEAVVVTEGGESFLKKVRVPWKQHLVKSVYIGYLAVLQQSYDQSVVTLGAMLNLLGISFFILTIVAVYTANLAAILTQDVQKSSIDSFDDAVRAKFRFCSERKVMEIVLNLYPNLDQGMFVEDPRYMGGDGMPGFNCADCQSRVRVFDFLDPDKANAGDPRFCHAALAPGEDMEVLHASATHCNKSMVGKPVQIIQTGMPLFEAVSPQLISFFLKLKNDGHYDSALVANQPNSQCLMHNQGGEGTALTLVQLSGIWVVSFGFAAAGLLATFISNRYKNQVNRNSVKSVRRVHKRDQKGGRVDALGIEDCWMTATQQNTSVRPTLLHQGSSAGPIFLIPPEDSDGASTSERSKARSEHSFFLKKNKGTSDQGPLLRRRCGSSPSLSNGSSLQSASQPNVVRFEGLGSGTIPENDIVGAPDAVSKIELREKLLEIIDEQASKETEDVHSALHSAINALSFSSSKSTEDYRL